MYDQVYKTVDIFGKILKGEARDHKFPWQMLRICPDTERLSPAGYISLGQHHICLNLYCTSGVQWSVQFSSVAQSCPTLCNPMDCSTPGLPDCHQLPEFTQTHVHRVRDAIQPSHPLSSPSPPAFSLSQHQGLFKWVTSSHQVIIALNEYLSHKAEKQTWTTI